ncbi:hypothetical protein PFMC_02209 [Plasmodium falciparum CAMP/Malaysia]|uniref:Uncharacterized protein n=1 Tax=Plasmodium falciparum (isolate Camp / Malaysia) TaxID=5835 RepID=A0A024X9F2_PLAFC|nr:hypothetical protein PFMC_02209 [Plasmodium falciparum CAMP/Malaysia]
MFFANTADIKIFICEYKYYLPANIDNMLLFVIFSENYIINYLKKLQMIFMLIITISRSVTYNIY